MSKRKIYTVLILCVSLAVIIGGWFFIRGMLYRKETEILAHKGEILGIVADTEVIVNEKKPETGKSEGVVLGEDEISEVLTVWNTGGREVLHEPLPGQMNMEQAINAGKEWIGRLAENGILPEHLSGCSFDNISAVLCSPDSGIYMERDYLSYWKVTYVKGDVEIGLIIHALNGQVWNASITMNEDNMLYGTCSDQEILSIAFPFLENGDEETGVNNNTQYKITEKGTIYATIKRDSIMIDREEPKARLLLGLCTNTE